MVDSGLSGISNWVCRATYCQLSPFEQIAYHCIL